MKISTVVITLAALVASPALAGDAPKRSYGQGGPNVTTPGPATNCYGDLCSGDTQTVNISGGILRAGTAGAMFDAGEDGIGESGASSEGTDSVDLGLYVNSCAEECSSNRIAGTMTANQHNQSYGWAVTNRPGQAAVTSSVGISGVTFDFRTGVDACPGGCPSPSVSTDD